MAACGLDPSRRESTDSLSNVSLRQNSPYGRAVVLTMVEFAAAMMMQVQNFNRGSFQSLNLRIGELLIKTSFLSSDILIIYLSSNWQNCLTATIDFYGHT